MNILLQGRIDSLNAADAEKEIMAQVEGVSGEPIVLDAEKLEYISSAGLRVILRLRKSHSDLRIINVNSDIYEILSTTGFTEMMTVEKAYRVVTVEGCEEIGRGANGTIYRIDHDNVVKVYNNADALEDIQHERDVARLALILGIPTAISYDVVKVGESYGSVFELLNASSFSKILASQPEKIDWCVKEYTDLLKIIHSTVVPEGKLPDMKSTVLSWVKDVLCYIPEEYGKKLTSLVEAVPRDNHMIHGDYHTKNVMMQNDEVLLIDMDTLAVGYPIFELAQMYNSYIGFSEQDPSIIKKFQGFDADIAKEFWEKSLAAYLGTNCKLKIKEVEDKAKVISYTRLVRHVKRHGESDDVLAFRVKELINALDKVDTLLFDPNELEVEAETENLIEVQNFIDERLDAVRCPSKAKMQISVAVEEIYVNIAHYAYSPEKGNATVRVEISGEPIGVTITFMDNGTPYDPVSRTDPDVTLSAEERNIGGLGIFMTKKIMDDVAYEYKDGKNILTLKKTL